MQAEAYAGTVRVTDASRSAMSRLAGTVGVTEGPTNVGLYDVTVEPGTVTMTTELAKTYGVVVA